MREPHPGAPARSGNPSLGDRRRTSTLKGSSGPCRPKLHGGPVRIRLGRAAKAATLQRRLSSISQAHQAAGHPTPTIDPLVRAVHAGIRRAKGTAPTDKAPAVTAELRAMVAALPNDLRGVRDRAMLLIGFAAAPRRSEPVALDIADVAETAGGLVVTLRRS
ncbi:MAG: hypothetical protein M3083_20855 [Actinomycetota bacterium]|nr:hypothetical protein [Actinomycetota bacterium]